MIDGDDGRRDKLRRLFHHHPMYPRQNNQMNEKNQRKTFDHTRKINLSSVGRMVTAGSPY